MKDVVIVGAGGAAAELTFYIEDFNANNPGNEKIHIRGYVDYTEDFWKKYRFNRPFLCDIYTYQPK